MVWGSACCCWRQIKWRSQSAGESLWWRTVFRGGVDEWTGYRSKNENKKRFLVGSVCCSGNKVFFVMKRKKSSLLKKTMRHFLLLFLTYPLFILFLWSPFFFNEKKITVLLPSGKRCWESLVEDKTCHSCPWKRMPLWIPYLQCTIWVVFPSTIQPIQILMATWHMKSGRVKIFSIFLIFLW